MKRAVRKTLSCVIASLFVFVNLCSVFIGRSALPVMGETLPAVKPVTLQNVKYIYQQNVKKVDLSKYNIKDGLLIPPSGVNLASGNIIVDELIKTAYFIQRKNQDGSFVMRKPTMREVFENFEIPKQTVKYNDFNIIDLQPAIQNARRGIANPREAGTITINKVPPAGGGTGGTGQQKVASLSSEAEKQKVEAALAGGWEYGFQNSKLDAYFEDGTKLSVTLSGKIKTKMDFDVNYSMFGGYQFGTNSGQIIGLKAALEVKIKKEVYIPIIAIDMNFGIGGVRAGLFLVVGIDGKVTLVVSAEEGTSFNAGIKGDTSFGIPTSFKPYSEPHAYYSAECDPNGKITAYAYLTPCVSVRVLGIDVFKAEIRLGFLAYAEEEGNFLNYGVNAVAQFYVAVLGKGRFIINSSFNLFSRKKESPPGGFHFYGDLCAYRDDAIAAVYKSRLAGDEMPGYIKDPFIDKLPYTGKVQLYYYRGNETTKPYKVVETELGEADKGVFKYNFKTEAGIDVLKGDSYRIVIPENSKAFSNNVFSTIPFKGIKLDKADFFNEIAFGQVMPASAHRDMPGWALTDIKTEGKLDQIFCSNRTATVSFVDPKGRNKKVSATALTDSEGRFKVGGHIDIRPYRKAIPYVNVDGFEIQGNAIDTTAGIYFIFGSDYVSNLTSEKIVQGSDGKEIKAPMAPVDNDNIADGSRVASEEYTSGDHILGVNEFGTKKIVNTVNYSTNSYFVKDVEDLLKNAIVIAKLGTTVDLRKMIMDSRTKQLIYNDSGNIPINEDNNNQISLFQGNVNTAAKKALLEGQPMSSSHAYHRLSIKDGKFYQSPAIGRSSPGKIIPTRPEIAGGGKITLNKNNFSDILDPLQQKGVDATAVLNMGGKDLTNNYADFSVYVDTVASINIEGYKLLAEQADPWIIEGQKQPTTGISPEDKLKNEINGLMKEGVLYFKRFVTNPIQYSNNLQETWRPAMDSVKHELTIDYARGSMSIDGIKYNDVSKGNLVSGKLYLPAAPLARMMGGSASFNDRTKELVLNAAGRSAILKTSSRTVSVRGKNISLGSEVIGANQDIQISTEAISKMFGASIKVDKEKSGVTISFLGN